MGSFSNGTEGDYYEQKYCSKCYWGDKACMIWYAHLEYSYEECNKEKSFLDLFIPRSKDKLTNEKCTMFIDKEAVK
jgi:hypothetical protein